MNETTNYVLIYPNMSPHKFAHPQDKHFYEKLVGVILVLVTKGKLRQLPFFGLGWEFDMFSSSMGIDILN